MDFQTQMATLQQRSDAAMELGPPEWLTRPRCLDGPLTAEELEQFFTEGFLIKQAVFTREELQPVVHDIEAQVEALARKLLQAGKITDACEGLGFYQRMHGLEKQFKGASVLLHKTPGLPPSFQRLWADPRLLDMAQQLLGGKAVDVAGHPVWNLRVKVPQADSAVVPWHQDAAYLDPESAHTLQVTAWIPLIDATAQNGCMQVIRRGHLTGRTARHACCAGGTWYVEMDMDDACARLGVDCRDEARSWATCEMPMGAVLLLSNLVPHRSLPNTSGDIRWSLDLRWQDARLPAGFWGIKDTILMRKAGDGEAAFQPDWAGFAAVDRGRAQSRAAHDGAGAGAVEAGAGAGAGAGVVKDEGKGEETLVSAAAAEAGDDLEPVIAGPWMLRWQIVHHNQHTALLEAQQQEQQEKEEREKQKQDGEAGKEGGDGKGNKAPAGPPAGWHKA